MRSRRLFFLLLSTPLVISSLVFALFALGNLADLISQQGAAVRYAVAAGVGLVGIALYAWLCWHLANSPRSVDKEAPKKE